MLQAIELHMQWSSEVLMAVRFMTFLLVLVPSKLVGRQFLGNSGVHGRVYTATKT